MQPAAKRLSIGLVVTIAGMAPVLAQNSNQQMVSANNRFAIDIFRKMSPQPGENAFVSPYSISSALAMTWAGAKGDTANEMAKALQFPGLTADDVTQGFSSLNSALAEAQANSGAQLSVANSLWPEQSPDHPLLPSYLNIVQKDFAAGILPVDYQGHFEDARLKINRWVEEKTQNKITNLLHQGDINSATRLVLANAIYFKGQWLKPFSEDATKEAPFHLANGSSRSAKLMSEVLLPGEARYADITSGTVPCQVLSLNYFSGMTTPRRGANGRASMRSPSFDGPGISMMVVLPRDGSKLGELEKSLGTDEMAAWGGALKPASVRVFLPKFRLEQRYDQLTSQLKSMGMIRAFAAPGTSDGADFSGMSGARDLFISTIIHQSFVAVDEKGTEAAAATALAMAAGMARPEEPAEFRADHPFLFFIRENATGSILFMGRLADPVSGK